MLAMQQAIGQDAFLRTQVQDPRALLMAAIKNPSGTAYGVLVGQLPEAIGKQFSATSPMHVDVTTLKRYKQPGCSRLNIRIRQEGIQLPGAKSGTTQTVDVGLNYCLNGRPPTSLAER
jgi:hypothetical protein